MLTIKYLKLNNFITYKDQIFNFEELFKDDNILLIYGKNRDDTSFANDNGSGKSLIYEAFLFLLTNRTTKNSNRDSLIGKFSKSMSVEGKLSDGKNVYWIKRYRKDKHYKNNVRFKINGKEKKKSTQTELTDLINNILNISYRRLINTSIFESNDERSRFVYLGDKDAKSLLSQIKGLEIFSECEKIAKNEINDIEKEIIILDNELDKISLIRKRIKKDKIENNKLSIGFNKNKKLRILDIKRNIKKIKKNLKEGIRGTLTVKNRHEKKILELKRTLTKIKNIDKLNNQIDILNKDIKSFQEHNALIKANLKNDENTITLIKENKKNIGLICQNCGNTIENEKLLEHYERAKVFRKSNKSNLKAGEAKLYRKYNDLKEIESKIEKINRNNLKNSSTMFEILNYKSKIKMLNKLIYNDEKSSKEQISKNMELIEKIKNEKDTHKAIVEKLTRELNKIKKDKAKIKEDLIFLKEDFKLKSVWHIGFGKEGIQSYALESTINELNDNMRTISEELTDGILDIKILTSKTQGNKKIRNIFEFEISDLNKKNLPFKEWSKGQKKRLEIIVSFALMNIENNLLNEVFLDELFDGIDETGIIKIKDMLDKEATKKGKKFIILSHSKSVKQLFNNKAYIELKNGRSKLI